MDELLPLRLALAELDVIYDLRSLQNMLMCCWGLHTEVRELMEERLSKLHSELLKVSKTYENKLSVVDQLNMLIHPSLRLPEMLWVDPRKSHALLQSISEGIGSVARRAATDTLSFRQHLKQPDVTLMQIFMDMLSDFCEIGHPDPAGLARSALSDLFDDNVVYFRGLPYQPSRQYTPRPIQYAQHSARVVTILVRLMHEMRMLMAASLHLVRIKCMLKLACRSTESRISLMSDAMATEYLPRLRKRVLEACSLV